MNDFFDAMVACGLGLGMWCFTEAPEEPKAEPPVPTADERFESISTSESAERSPRADHDADVLENTN